jgi:sigma-B regulation protein RsbU (phosphoserine phosphatase)
VSDKGIPAALFMAMTNTLIKAISLTGISPAEVLYKVNNELCKENEQGMFVTLFLGKLNMKTGVVEYANAGHNPSVIIQNNKSGYHKLASGIVLAAFENFSFTNEQLTLASGDAILMYTDGVTEAMNAEHKLFGEDRLLDVVTSQSDTSVTNLIESVVHAVETHVQEYEQSDDITVLSLRFN